MYTLQATDEHPDPAGFILEQINAAIDDLDELHDAPNHAGNLACAKDHLISTLHLFVTAKETTP